MENIGALSILLAFCFAVYAVVASVTGRLKKNSFLIVSGQRAVYSVWLLLTVASGLLIYSLFTGDFRLAYVAAHTDSSMKTIYKFTAWWGGQEGSLLLWAWLLATYSTVVVFMNRRKFRDMMPWVTSVLMTTEAFFLILISFVLSPFRCLEAGRGNLVEGVGQGLNPLLQYWTMVIHPPMLYLGYVGFTVPFAFAMGSLITKQPGDAWIHTTRRWTIVTWLFQSAGILLGQGWAYAVLGWGGYWAWDPVENASLLPWITATAFLHSVMMQEKKGMMKVWNMVLISGTFFLCIFGTFLTRSGVVQLGACFRAVAHRQVLRDVPGYRHRGDGHPDPGALEVSEERSAPGKRGLARIQLHVQQPDPGGQLLRGAVGHHVPGDLGSCHRRENQRGCTVLQSHQYSDRPVPAFSLPASVR